MLAPTVPAQGELTRSTSRTIRRVGIVDPFHPREGRFVEDMPWIAGMTLADALPRGAIEAPAVVRVTHNGGLVDPEDWASRLLAPGDYVGVVVLPGEPVTAIIFIASAIISAWSAYDANRRGKIRAHHAARRSAAQAQAMSDSLTYGFDGFQNTTQPGRPIPVLYGQHKVAGQVIYAQTYRDAQGKSRLNVVIAISEGEIEALDLTTVRLNDQPLSDYPNVLAFAVLGTNAQAVPSTDVFDTSSPVRTNKPGNSMALSGTVTYVTGANISAYELDVRMYALGSTQPPATGRLVNGYARRTFSVRHREFPAGAWSTAQTFSTGWKSIGVDFPITYRSPQLSPSRYEIELTHTALDFKPSTYVLHPSCKDPYLGEVREYATQSLAYPNLALLYLTAIATDQINGMLPTVTSVPKGRKIRIYTAAPSAGDTDGTYTEEFSRNPAWCILDLLTHTRYGAGAFHTVGYETGGSGTEDQSDPDIASFITAAAYCDTLVARLPAASQQIDSGTGTLDTRGSSDWVDLTGGDVFTAAVQVDDTLVLDGADGGSYRIEAINTARNGARVATVTGGAVSFAGTSGNDWTVNATERRAQCDYYLDGSTDAQGAVEAMAAAANLQIVQGFGPIKCIPDTTGSAVQLFSMGNIIEGSYRHEYLAHKQLANRMEVQFLNAELDYQQDVGEVEDPAVLTNTEDVIKQVISGYSITRRTQAERLARRAWLSNRYERELLEFECAAEGLGLEWGDVFVFVHEITRVGQFFSGRIGVGSTTTSIVLDKPLVVPAGTVDVFVRYLREPSMDTQENNPISDVAGTRLDTVTASAPFSRAPDPGDIWVLVPRTAVFEQDKYWKVVDVSLSHHRRRRVQAVPYRTEVYDESAVVADVE